MSGGNSERPCLVLIHGWGLNSGIWQSLLPALEADWQVRCLDLPGFGERPRTQPLELRQMAETLLADTPRGAWVLGWSLGGLVAIEMALQAPEGLAGIIGLAASPCFLQQPDWPGIKPEVLGQFAQQLAEDHAATVQRFLAIQAMGSPSAREDVKRLRQALAERPAPDPRALTEGLALLQQTDLRPRLPELQVPWERWYGRLDALVPVASAQAVAALAPASASHLFSKASHAPFVSHPTEFLDRLQQLRRLCATENPDALAG